MKYIIIIIIIVVIIVDIVIVISTIIFLTFILHNVIIFAIWLDFFILENAAQKRVLTHNTDDSDI